MATARRAQVDPTDPATVPDWVLSFGADAAHWTALVDPADEPPDYETQRISWTRWEAGQIHRFVASAWLQEHAPDLNLYDLWDERRRRAGLLPIHHRGSARLRALAAQGEPAMTSARAPRRKES